MFALLILWGKILGSLLVLFLLAGIWWVYFQKGSLSVTVGTSGFPFFLPFRLRRKILRSMHIHCMGTSGYGKSTFAANYVTELILQGQAVSVIDPHNDLSDLILQNLWDRGCFNQPNWQKKVWYIEFNRKDRFVPWCFC